jgi:hypothetical protein
MNRRDASRIRQLLLRAERAREPHVALLLALRPLIEGSFVTLGRKCGKPNCRCARGQLHDGNFLSRSEGGRSSLTYVRRGDEHDVAAKAGSYRQLRRARAELMKLATKTAELIDALQQALAEPYPSEGDGASRKRRAKKKRGGSDS